MKDFTYTTYRSLLQKLREAGYAFQRLEDFCEKPGKRVVIMRHDVDIWSKKALPFARLEIELGIQASYYFRILYRCFEPSVVREIVSLGHEIGYHYEELTYHNGNMKKAIKSFENNLAKLREFYPVKTICMHGRSGSPHDNRDLWKSYDISKYDLVCEPYLNLDFNRVLYLSDTTQSWNDSNIAVRDKVESGYDFSFRTTFDIIDSVDELPDQIMFNVHPDIWAESLGEWLFLRYFVGFHSLYKKYYRNKKVKRSNQ
ncbi:MAG: hypothetical protein K0B81_09625 [Candidatus Cloacimonetes bacterium]|nr:hypothetical protein [Candidatus Cloacimonadota bacterium]